MELLPTEMLREIKSYLIGYDVINFCLAFPHDTHPTFEEDLGCARCHSETNCNCKYNCINCHGLNYRSFRLDRDICIKCATRVYVHVTRVPAKPKLPRYGQYFKIADLKYMGIKFNPGVRYTYCCERCGLDFVYSKTMRFSGNFWCDRHIIGRTDALNIVPRLCIDYLLRSVFTCANEKYYKIEEVEQLRRDNPNQELYRQVALLDDALRQQRVEGVKRILFK